MISVIKGNSNVPPFDVLTRSLADVKSQRGFVYPVAKGPIGKDYHNQVLRALQIVPYRILEFGMSVRISPLLLLRKQKKKRWIRWTTCMVALEALCDYESPRPKSGCVKENQKINNYVNDIKSLEEQEHN